MELNLVDLSPVYQRLFHYIFDIKFCNEIYFCKEMLNMITKGEMINMTKYRYEITLINGRLIEFENDSPSLNELNGFITIHQGLKVNINHVMIMQCNEVFDKE